MKTSWDSKKFLSFISLPDRSNVFVFFCIIENNLSEKLVIGIYVKV